MINWTRGMIQTFKFYQVDPRTWKDSKQIHSILSCTIDRDLTTSTLGRASLKCSEYIEESYVRIYLEVNQNGEIGRFPLGTYLLQTSSTSFDGRENSMNVDAYTPLIELKDNNPPLGYSILKGQEIMSGASAICRENMRAPVVGSRSVTRLYSNFVANTSDNWLTFIQDLIAQARYKITLHENGTVLFEPIVDVASLQPVWTYSDNNSSILFPNIKDERDLYDIPNVVEVIYSTDRNYLYSRIVNDDPSSPVSTVTRGREIIHRDTSPQISGTPSQQYLDEYAVQKLRNLSSLEHRIIYKHGYCPVRIGDCVILDYKRAGISNIKAQVISQSIECSTSCQVEETAVYTTKLWR